MTTDNAYVHADMRGVIERRRRHRQQVAVRDNQKVANGDVLFTLDQKPFRTALDRAEAQLGITRNELQALAGELAQTCRRRSSRPRRMSRLHGPSSASRTSPKDDFTRAGAARQRRIAICSPRSRSWPRYAAARPASPPSSTATPMRPSRASALQGDARRARRGRAPARPHDRARADSTASSPTCRRCSPASISPARTTAFAWSRPITCGSRPIPKETELTYVQPGQPAVVDGRHLSRARWTRHGREHQPGLGASFSLLPAQNTSGNWVKVVQRIPMRVRVDSGPASRRCGRHERRGRASTPAIRAACRPVSAACSAVGTAG